MYELGKLKVAEQLQHAERQRLAPLAVSDRPRPIDILKVGTRASPEGPPPLERC